MAVKRWNATSGSWETWAGFVGTPVTTLTLGTSTASLGATTSSISNLNFISASTISASTATFSSDIVVDSNLNLGTGAGDSTNLRLGNGTLSSITSLMTNNVAIGYYAMNSSSAGYNNTAIGSQALQTNIGGLYNTAIGSDTLVSNVTGGYNTAIGGYSMRDSLIGNENTAVGYFTLTTGSGFQNTAVGNNAMQNNLSGSYNSAFGYGAMAQNSNNTGRTGNYNVGIGYYALVNTSQGSNNTAVGANALGNTASSNYNTAIGYLAGFALPATSSYTVILGSNNGSGIGSNNVVLADGQGNIVLTASGTSSAVNISSGSLAIGTSARPAAALNVVAIGSNALIDTYDNTQSPSIILRRARNTEATASPVLSGNALGTFGFRGYGTSSWGAASRAAMVAYAAENWTDIAQGSYFTFETTPIGSTTRAERLRIADDGTIKIGGTASIGGDIILIPTATNATALANSMEIGTTATLYNTGTTASSRGILTKTQIIAPSANHTLTSSGTVVQNWFAADTGATTASINVNNLSSVYLEAGTAYRFRGQLNMSRAVGTTSHTTAIQLAHAASATSSISYMIQSTATTGNALGAVSAIKANVWTPVVATAANTSGTENNIFYIDGVVRVTTAGWMTPRFQYSAGPGGIPTIAKDSYFEVYPIGASWSTNSYEAL